MIRVKSHKRKGRIVRSHVRKKLTQPKQQRVESAAELKNLLNKCQKAVDKIDARINGSRNISDRVLEQLLAKRKEYQLMIYTTKKTLQDH